MTMTTHDTHAEWTFESALQRLAEIADALESDGLELDDSLQLFEEGVRLLRFAETVLTDADQRLKVLLEEAAGSFRMDEFAEPL